MRKVFKKAISVLLVAVMVFGAAPLSGLTGIDFGDLFPMKASADETDVHVMYLVTWIVEGELWCIESVEAGSVIFVPDAPTSKNGYKFVGWVDKDGNEMPEIMPSENMVFYAVFEKPKAITSYKQGDIIKFGWYPQSEVTDSSIISELNSLADDNKSWTSYGYYSGTGSYDGQMTKKDYMRYKDVMYGSDKYRGVVFDTYRKNHTVFQSTTDNANTSQYNNGYYVGTVYWFKYEPIKWRVLDPAIGMVIAETILDSQAYNNYVLRHGTDEHGKSASWGDSTQTYYANSYAHSSIREWLNKDFYNTAFSTAQQNIIEYTALDNSAWSESDSVYDSETTYDKMYLLSYDTTLGYSDSRAQGSDYAKCQGLTSTFTNDGYSNWWLRTPGSFSSHACYSYFTGMTYYDGYSVDITSIGVRPALNFNLTSEIFQSNVKDTGNSSADGTIDSGKYTKKISVFTNNMSLSYFKGDKIYFSVTEIEDGIWNIPENIIVTSSDNRILKFEQMGKKDWFKHFLISFAPTKYEKLKSYMSAIIPKAFEDCKFICFEAINPGNAVVTITNNDTGEKVEIPISVSDDEYYSLRADRVPENDWSLEILGKEVEHDIYNYNVNGMMVTDFEYTEIGNEYNFKMNIYNRKYSSGVVEVYDENYNLIEVHKISGRDTSTTGLVETFEAGWGLVKSISDYDMLSFRAPHQTKHTQIDIKVPKGGGIIITNDSAASTSCFLFNLFDAALSTRSLISDVQSLPEGQIDIIERKLLENLIADKVKMELADSLKEKAADLVLEDISDAAVKSLIKSIDQIIYEYMESLDIDLNEICKTAVKETGGELIEDVFGKYAGPAGTTINALFMGEKFHEFYIKILDWTDTIGTQCTEGILTPLDKNYEEGSICSVDGISVDTKNNVPSETILQTIRLYDGYNEFNIRNLSTDYVIRNYKTYDISLVRNGEKVQPNGNVELYIPIPHGFEHVRVARQNDDGTWSFLNTKVRDGIAIVEVDHFCMFVILDVDEDKTEKPILIIPTPSTTTINYGDKIVLHANIEGELPAGYQIKWISSNDNFSMSVSADGKSCTISPESSGETVFTAVIVDENDNAVSSDEQTMTSKAGFFQKIIAFFKKLFGLTKTIPQSKMF